MSGQEDDHRFSRFASDPKFKTVPRKKKKVKIDERFGSLFKDKSGRFSAPGTTVDKRGRPIKKTAQRDNYSKYYRMKGQGASSSSSSDDDDDEEAKPGSSATSKASKKAAPAEVKKKLRDMTVDYARGEGNLYSDDSSTGESESDVDSSDDDEGARKGDGQAVEQFDKWGELDRDAEVAEEATRRVAVCNMDWDRVGAQDIFIAMSSFCPTGKGGVKSVKVFISDFGKKRKAEEDKLGPEELRGGETAPSDDDDDESDEGDQDAEEFDKKAMERVRRYQINRLKYYYAVVEFDSASSANKVYEECDGQEYELSATRFDLRFIPDDMDFEDEPEAVCESMPDPDKYRPKQFSTTALSLGKVELTWDETDPERQLAMRKAFEEGQEEDDAVKALIAMSSSDEEDNDHKEDSTRSDEAASDGENDNDAIAKYKALLGELVEDKNKKSEGDMQISWGASDKTKKNLEAKEFEKMAPWDQYLHKKKEKSKSKREERKKKAKAEAEGGEEDKLFSDDELPEGVDFDDPFFKEEIEKRDKVKKKSKKKEKRTDGEEKTDDLSLLVMDDEDDGRRHFDYKDTVANEAKSKKKRKRKAAEAEIDTPVADDFDLNLSDSRFQDVFHNPEFNVDPSNPHFKKTKSMQKLVEEKQRRIAAQPVEIPSEAKTVKSSKSPGTRSDISSLVRAVQTKTASGSGSKPKKKKAKKV